MSRTILLRTMSTPDATVGRLKFGDLNLYTLELPWLSNAKDKSCVPSGIYDWFKRTSPKNGAVIELKNVPNRNYIQMHVGNYTRQTAGCILAGTGIAYENGQTPCVTNSRDAMNALLMSLPDYGKIVIERAFAENMIQPTD